MNLQCCATLIWLAKGECMMFLLGKCSFSRSRCSNPCQTECSESNSVECALSILVSNVECPFCDILLFIGVSWVNGLLLVAVSNSNSGQCRVCGDPETDASDGTL